MITKGIITKGRVKFLIEVEFYRERNEEISVTSPVSTAFLFPCFFAVFSSPLIYWVPGVIDVKRILILHAGIL